MQTCGEHRWWTGMIQKSPNTLQQVEYTLLDKVTKYSRVWQQEWELTTTWRTKWKRVQIPTSLRFRQQRSELRSDDEACVLQDSTFCDFEPALMAQSSHESFIHVCHSLKSSSAGFLKLLIYMSKNYLATVLICGGESSKNEQWNEWIMFTKYAPPIKVLPSKLLCRVRSRESRRNFWCSRAIWGTTQRPSLVAQNVGSYERTDNLE